MAKEFTLNGKKFFWECDSDCDSLMPWDECDGIGYVEVRHASRKAPHEVLIHSERHAFWFYDLRASMAKAKRESWGLPEAETMGLTKKQIIAKAVQKDMDYCREWLEGSRYFVCLKVWPAGEPEKATYLGGIEYCEAEGDEYLIACAQEMAQEIGV